MARGLKFTVELTVLIALVLVHPTSCAITATVNDNSTASSCVNIHNIIFPFRLKSDPENCGDSRYVLSCENNRTVLYLYGGKYYVQEISYNNCTIRIVDSSILKYNYLSIREDYYSSSTPADDYLYPSHYSYYGPFHTYLRKRTKTGIYREAELSRSLVLISCEKPVKSPLYLDTSACNYNDNSSSTSDSKRYRHVKVGETNASQVEDSCQVEKVLLSSWPINNDDPNRSCTDVHHELAYGFELSWLEAICESSCGGDIDSCYLDDANHVQCGHYIAVNVGLLDRIQEWVDYYKRHNAFWWNALVKNIQHRCLD